MPLNEWDVLTTSGMHINTFFGLRRLGPTIFPDLVSGSMVEQDVLYPSGLLPLVSTGSLQMRGLLSGNTGLLYRANAGQRGWSNGSITSIFYVGISAGVNTGGAGFGYYCFVNQLDLRNSGSAYLIGCTDAQFSGEGYNYNIFLNKVTSNGVRGYYSTNNLLFRVSNSWTLNTTFTLRVNWTQETPTMIVFDVLTGTAIDFSDLTQLFSYRDFSAFSTTTAEGIWGGSSQTNLLKFFMDNTDFYKGIRS